MLFVGIYDRRDIGGRDVFNEIVVDERDGRGAATGEAFNEFDAEFPVGGGWRSLAVAMMFAMRVETHSLAEFFLHLVASSEGAGEGAADADDGFSGLLAAEPRVESDKLEDVDRGEIEAGGDPIDAGIIDEAEMVLPQVEKREGRAAFRDGIVGNQLIGLGDKLGGEGVRLARL